MKNSLCAVLVLIGCLKLSQGFRRHWVEQFIFQRTSENQSDSHLHWAENSAPSEFLKPSQFSVSLEKILVPLLTVDCSSTLRWKNTGYLRVETWYSSIASTLVWGLCDFGENTCSALDCSGTLCWKNMGYLVFIHSICLGVSPPSADLWDQSATGLGLPSLATYLYY